MTSRKMKTATPVPSVGADGGQPNPMYNKSIAVSSNEINNNGEKSNISTQAACTLKTITMKELYENIYEGKIPIIDGLLYAGTYLFVGAPKVGKSFLMAQLAYHVSTGLPIWGFHVRQGTVLYLALEDDHKRLQGRLYRMFGTESTEHLHFAISAHNLSGGLDKQLQAFIETHTDTRLVILDTLQKVREANGEKFSYANDYEIVGQLKRFADKMGICFLLVHHTRKQQAEDKFDMISGTNGLLGAADGAFLLEKEMRTSNSATLDISGRDQQDQRLYLSKDMERLTWQLEKAETELWKEPPDMVLEAIACLVTEDKAEWCGSPTELVGVLGLNIKANTLTQRLNINAERLRREYSIGYAHSRSRAGRMIKLTLVNGKV